MSILLIIVMIITSTHVIYADEEMEFDCKVDEELLNKIGVTYKELIEGDFKESDDQFSCVIWLTDVDLTEAIEAGEKAAEYAKQYSPEADSVQVYIEAKREKTEELYLEKNRNFVDKYLVQQEESIWYISKYSPCIFVDLTLTEILNMLENQEVMCISNSTKKKDKEWRLLSDTDMTQADIEMCKSIIRADEASDAYGLTGAGVKIGIIELAYVDEVGVIKKPNQIFSYEPYEYEVWHAYNDYTILKSIAPNATYYSTGLNEASGDFYEQIEWLLSSGVNVISCSMGSPDYMNQYDEDTRWIDHIAYNHDVHFVQAAGNQGAAEPYGIICPGMAYNIITVGNSYMTEPYYRDRKSSYNVEGNDRIEQRASKPDILAPATCTSYATPMVSGAVALLCHLDPALKTKQPIMKAILAAGAGARTRNYVTEEANFKKYGAGILDVYASSYIVAASRYSTSTGIMGTAVGATKTYNMLVTSSDTRMRVALAYTNRIDMGTNSTTHSTATSATIPNGTIAEMIVYVVDPQGNVRESIEVNSSTDGCNLKVLEFDTEGIAGYYQIVVMLVLPASGSRMTNFGVAWW